MKILIFVMRYLAYESNACFAEQLAAALRDAGADVEFCDLLNDDDMGATLAEYAGAHFDAVVDMNSTLPRAMYGKERFPDVIDAPFFNFIVDHPLYHHPILKLALKDMNVICVDCSHARYIRKYYPHIHKVLPVFIPGTHSAVRIPRNKRHKSIFFSGTYYPPEKYSAMISDGNPELVRLRKALAERLIYANAAECVLTPEKALSSTLADCGRELPPDSEFRELLNSCYPAEIYARAIRRLDVLDKFAKSGLPLCICGNDWEESPLAGYKNVQLIDGEDYRTCVDMIASSAMVLNIMPGFTEGSHDRLLTAMENLTPVISDVNTLLSGEFTDGVYMIYHHGEPPAHLEKLLDDNTALEKMALAACDRARSFSGWETIAGAFLALL